MAGKPLDWKDRIVEIKRMRIADISGHRGNPKRHPKNQADAMTGLLNEVGKADVLKAFYSEAHGGKLTLWDGHLRQGLDPDQEWWVAITDLSDEEAKLMLVAFDPIAHLAQTDAAALEALLQSVNTGDEALQKMLADMATEAGIVPPDKPAVSAPGDDISETEAEKLAKQYDVRAGQVWQLGDHLIACVDSLNEQEIKNVIGVNKVSAVWADPPYGINIVAANGYVGGGEAYDIPFGGAKKRRGNVGGGESIKARTGLYPIQMKKGERLGTVGGAKPFGNEKIRGTDGTANMIDVGKYAPVIGDDTTQTAERSSGLYLGLYPDALHFWWGANYYANALPPSSCWIVWDKENTGNFADAELAWCSDKSAVRIFKHMWNGLMKDSEKGKRRVHPTQKPVALAHWCFEKYGKTGDVIVDPFLGSGISVLAAEQLNNRRVIGFELAPEYIAVTIHRWELLTGRKAELVTNRQPVRVE